MLGWVKLWWQKTDALHGVEAVLACVPGQESLLVKSDVHAVSQRRCCQGYWWVPSYVSLCQTSMAFPSSCDLSHTREPDNHRPIHSVHRPWCDKQCGQSMLLTGNVSLRVRVEWMCHVGRTETIIDELLCYFHLPKINISANRIHISFQLRQSIQMLFQHIGYWYENALPVYK